MEENKDLINTPDEEITAEQASEALKGNQGKQIKKKNKAPKIAKIKNQAALKKGGYSIVITALVLAGLVLFNWLISLISDWAGLEIDMTADKKNSISKENLEYIESVDEEVNIIVCADKGQYVTYMAKYAQYMSNASGDSEYYEQTLKLIDQYEENNKKITVEYIDPQSSEFVSMTQAYPNFDLTYGDIVVSSKPGGADANERVKKIGFKDIYNLYDASGGYGQYYGYTIDGNNIETALTSAVAYVTSSEIKKIALLTGHSTIDNTDSYVKLLDSNNYDVELISDAIISSIPEDCDVVAIVTPSKDFVGSELDTISDFLDNNGELGKSLIFFADAVSPALPNLYEFLSQWGIAMDNGVLYETNSSYHVAEDPFTMLNTPGTDSITDSMSYCITGYVVPATIIEPTDDRITVTSLMTTSSTVVTAPSGASTEWSDFADSDKQTYPTIIQAKMDNMDSDGNKHTGYVMVFSSVEFIQSEWAEYSDLSNKDITLAVTDRAAGISESEISFVSKTISNESYADQVTQSGSNIIMLIFMVILPLSLIVSGVYIFIRRKNA